MCLYIEVKTVVKKRRRKKENAKILKPLKV